MELIRGLRAQGIACIYISHKLDEVFSLAGPRDAVQHRMGLLTEDRRVSGFVGTMCIRENVSLASFRKIFGRLFIKRQAERRQVRALSDQLFIKAPGIGANVLSLSGGKQQKVVLAKWLMNEVRILFLDEPTRGIDVGAKVEVYNLMTQLARRGVRSARNVRRRAPRFFFGWKAGGSGRYWKESEGGDTL